MPKPSHRRAPKEITTETREEIVRLHDIGLGTRKIRDRVQLSRKVAIEVLKEAGREPIHPPQASKLLPFHDAIAEKVALGLTVSRILREIRQIGYQGGRTILAAHVRPLRAKLLLGPKKGVKRRFETAPGEEMQIDWSPYLVPIDGRVTRVHDLGCLLCASRKLHLCFYRDERQATLLEALAAAFAYFDGVALRVVLDNMATAVLGRLGPGKEPIWHERFAAFAAHYGFTPFACRVRDPDRKGKKEKSFRYLWDDFIKLADDDIPPPPLDGQGRLLLGEVESASRRLRTTRRRARHPDPSACRPASATPTTRRGRRPWRVTLAARLRRIRATSFVSSLSIST